MALQTINFTIPTGDDSTKPRKLTFKLQSSPVIDSTDLVIGEEVCVATAADGTGTVALHPGNYKLEIDGEPNTSTIEVPTSGTPHRLESLTGAGTTYTNNDILSGGAEWPEQTTKPDAPAADKWKFYVKSDGNFYKQDEDGTETAFEAGAGITTVAEEGTNLTQRTTINFIGDAVTAADDSGNARTNVTISAMTASSTDTLTNKTFDANGTGNSISNIETADLASGAKTGSDTAVVTGTAGTNGDLAQWNGDGDLVDGPTPPSGTIVGDTDSQSLTNKTIDDFSNTVHADFVHIEVRNESGGALSAGDVVYVSGFSVGQAKPLVSKADASAAATMPAIGIMNEALANNATGEVIAKGKVVNVDTSAWSEGDILYVSETAGALTSTKPTGSALVQSVATVLRSHATNGILAVDSNVVPYVTGFAATLLDDGTAADARTTLGAISTSSTDSLTNKTFADHITVAEIAAPSTPASGFGALYAKTDGKIYFKDDGGTETDLTSGGGSSLPVDDTTAVVRDPVDNTKLARIDAGAITTGTTRVIAMGDRDVDLASGGTFAEASHVHATSDITSGTMADARIAESNVTQHQAALSITESQVSDLGTYQAVDTLLNAATGNEVALDLSYTVNKATSGNDTGIKINKTDTTSPGTSLLMDLQTGGVSQFTVDDAGVFSCSSISATGTIETIGGDITASTGDISGISFSFSSPAGIESIVGTDINGTMYEAYSVSGLNTNLISGTAGTGGDLAIWNEDGDLDDGPTPPSGVIIGTTDSQTLTNKTFDDDITIKEIAAPSTPSTGYGTIYAKTDGKLYFKNDGGTETELTAGGGGGGGAVALLSYDTLSASSSLTKTSIFTSDYDYYEIVVICQNSNAAAAEFQFTDGGTASTTGYYYHTSTNDSATATYQSNNYANATRWVIGDNATNNSTYRQIQLKIGLQKPVNSKYNTAHVVGAISDSGGNAQQVFGAMNHHVAMTSADGFKIYPSAGTWTGTIAVYGYSNT